MGYADRWSVGPGEEIAFFVSSEADDYDVEVVRLLGAWPRTGDTGSRPAYAPVGAVVDGSYRGSVHDLRPGSYVRVEDDGRLAELRSLTLQAWVYPTRPGAGMQGIVARRRAGAGFGLVLDATGAAAVHVGDCVLSSGVPLLARHWYLVVASIDLDAGVVRVAQQPRRRYAGDPDRASVEHAVAGTVRSDAEAHVLIGGHELGEPPGPGRRPPLRGGFDGKVDNPCVLGWALSAAELERVLEGEDARTFGTGAVLADWDFSADPALRRVAEAGGLDSETVNSPLRAVTGHAWTGDVLDHRLAPAQYSAIHFHSDDLDDADWPQAFRWRVPAGTRSGAYGVRLVARDAEDVVAFFVRPPRGRTTADAAVLASTFTYMAYANYKIDPVRATEMSRIGDVQLDPTDAFLATRDDLGGSHYNQHRDGSGIAHVSRLRPMLNARPGYRWWMTGAGGWSLGADMDLIDWLEATGVHYDVIADDDLHEEGLALLESYRVLLTGAHPEYFTAAMLDALGAYTECGGRLMYLGGNGFYWVVTPLPDRPHVLELRRGHAATRSWTSEPGENHHATGEPGGLWRHRGRAPQQLAGVGFCAQGAGPSAPYHALAASADPRAAFIFDGVEKDRPIGDFGTNRGGAAGAEIDRADPRLGTPPHALVVATSQGEHDELFLHVIEELQVNRPGQGGRECADVRADLTYFETPEGGAVFSTGSINWVASLSHEGYANPVARITDNVLKRFLDPEPLSP